MRIIRIFILAFVASATVGCKAENFHSEEERVQAQRAQEKTSGSPSVRTLEGPSTVELPPPMYMLFSAIDATADDKSVLVFAKARQSAADRLSDLFTSCGYSHLSVEPPGKEFDIYYTWSDTPREGGELTIYVWLSPRAFREYTMSELRRLHAGTAKTNQVTTCLQRLGYFQ